MPAINSIFSGIGLFLGGSFKPRPWLAPLSPVYWALSKINGRHMSASVTRSADASGHPEAPAVPLVVIGALKAGGSGKTSVTLELARAFTDRGLHVAILAYRLGAGSADADGPRSVLLEVGAEDDWRLSSEEALMLRRFSGARVFVTRDRAAAWKILRTMGSFDLILSDDGFQDPRLSGALRILLSEPGSDPGLFDLLPAGPYRETRSARRRADLSVSGPCPDLPDSPGPTDSLRFWRKLILPAGLDKNRPWIVFCGLGDNAPFLADLRREGILPVAVLEGRNHAAMPTERLVAASAKHPGAGFLCTRKDFIRLDGDLPARFTILAVDQSIRLDPRIPLAVEAFRLRYASVIGAEE